VMNKNRTVCNDRINFHPLTILGSKICLAKRWHSFGKIVAQNWQKNDNDLAEHLCYNPNMKNWDFGRSPSFLVYTTTDDRDICSSCVLPCVLSRSAYIDLVGHGFEYSRFQVRCSTGKTAPFNI